MGDKNRGPSNFIYLFTCPMCPFSSYKKESTMQHIDIAHAEKESSSTDENLSYCPFEGCGVQFDEPEHLQDHIDKLHPETSEHKNVRGQIKQEKRDSLEGYVIHKDATSIYVEEPIYVEGSDEEQFDFDNRQLREQPKSSIFDGENIRAAIHEDSIVAYRIQNMNKNQNNFQGGSRSDQVENESSSTDESINMCVFDNCSIQFSSVLELQKHIEREHEDPNENAKKTQNDKKMESSVCGDIPVSDESSQVLIIQMPNDKVDTVPTLETQVQFNGAIVPFSFLLLHAEFETAKKNVYELYSKKTTLKHSRPMAVEWLENRIPNAVHWNRSTLNDRFIKAERQASQFIETKAMANKTGMGSLESIKNKEDLLPSGVKETPSPANEIEEQMTYMMKELSQFRNNIKDFDTGVVSKKFKRTNKDEDGRNKKHLKGNAFMNSLKNKKPMFENPNLEDAEESVLAQSGDDMKQTRGNEVCSRFKKVDPKIKEVTVTSGLMKIKDVTDSSGLTGGNMKEATRDSGLKGTMKSKVQEADTVRRISVQDAYKNRFQSPEDDDVTLKNVAGSWDTLGSLATQLLQQELKGGPNNQEKQLVEQKLKTVEKSQENLELQMKSSSQRLDNIEKNQDNQNERLVGIEKNQDNQNEMYHICL